jgi:hypothetical protein
VARCGGGHLVSHELVPHGGASPTSHLTEGQARACLPDNAASMMPHELVAAYLAKNYRIVTWPHIGDSKGPKERGWPDRIYTLDDYHEGYRVGLLTGTEVAPERFLHDVDIDWAPGSIIAQKLLPATGFVFGRASKRISHCFYLTPEPISTRRYEDIDKTCLIELRGTKTNGDVGLQTMAPPSIWSKDTQREPLLFVKQDDPAFLEQSVLKQRVCLSAIGMLIARHLGTNGFGHEVRLAWAGFLLRAGIPVDDIVLMGEGISSLCNNLEVHDVRRSVESTANRLADPRQKIKGGPAFTRIVGEKGKAVVARINEWLGRDSDFIRDKDGLIVKDHQENIRRAVQLLDLELSHHEFAERMLIQEGGRPRHAMEDREINDLWLRIDRDYRFRPTFMFFEKVVKSIAYDSSFHPVRDYLNSLQWDGTPRINRWLEAYGGAPDSAYHQAVASIVLIAAVKRIRHPGCKYDEMLVLESDQGLNKSSALRALCPQDEWFSDDLPLNVDAKQIIERTLGKWIIEASDLAGKRKAEVEHLKAMLSRQVDGPARLAYAHFPVERARQFILIGTTNSKRYLTDATGARRFWPVTVQTFHVKAILRDRDQLWAEASVREAAGESIRLPEALWAEAGLHQEERQEIDAWELVLRELLSLRLPDQSGRIRIPLVDVWEAVQPDVSRRDRLGGMRISEIMHRLRYESGTMRDDGKVIRAYLSRPRSLQFDDET